MPKLQIRLIWIGFLATAFIAQAFAQGGATGAITGTVQDSSGAGVANAEVRITTQSTNILERTGNTHADGAVTAPLLPVATYPFAIPTARIASSDCHAPDRTTLPLPNPDVVQELNAQASRHDSNQARNGGGNINAILKSGTHTFHGDVSQFFRTPVLDANEFFLNQTGSPRPE